MLIVTVPTYFFIKCNWCGMWQIIMSLLFMIGEEMLLLK